MTHDIHPDEARRLLDADRERASREARLTLAREWWARQKQSIGVTAEIWNMQWPTYTPFGEFTVAELEGA